MACDSGAFEFNVADDTTPPVTSATYPRNNATGWLRDDANVTLNAYDLPGGPGHTPGTGVRSLTYGAVGAQSLRATTIYGTTMTIPISAEGETTLYYSATDQAGNQEALQTLSIKLDKTAPTIGGLRHKFVAVTRLPATSVPVTIFGWHAADPDPSSGTGQASGLDRYWLQQSVDRGTLQTLSLPSPLAPSARRYLTPGHSYSFQIRVVDAAGNISAPAGDATFTLGLATEGAPSAVYSGGWSSRSQAFAAGGAVRITSAPGATVTYQCTCTDLAWIATRGADRGRAEVRVDGGPATVVDLYSPTLQGRRIVFAASNLAPGTHTLQITTLAVPNPAASGTRVDVDAFLVLAPA
jgi:hypothetical protein